MSSINNEHFLFRIILTFYVDTYVLIYFDILLSFFGKIVHNVGPLSVFYLPT